ncbi:MAG: tetratricopeptide repeat protein [Pyrinomonadaceae bacterium]
MKSHLVFLTTVLLLFAIVIHPTRVEAKDTWISTQTKNFFLIGNTNEKDLKQVALRLEQFREVFTRIFTNANFASPVPTTVIVFKNDSSYRPFKSNPTNAGYFQPGPDVNYITLDAESRGNQDAFSIIFHEYTHLLVNNNVENPPLWFNEGLAEYYSTVAITDDQKVELGKPISNHVFLLRQTKMLPLRTLFQVDNNSPYYNEANKQSVFYAESWALLHYLLLGKNGQGQRVEMSKFLDLLNASTPVDKAFAQAFQTTFEAMEKELRDYVRQDRYRVVLGHFERKIELDTDVKTTPISEAEAQAYLGDLLLHLHAKGSEEYLQRALSLDPDLSMAHASLAMLRVREGKFDEALKSLERAAAANSSNYLIHYYYAYALSRQQPVGSQSVSNYAPAVAAKIREEAQKAIALRPDYPEPYSLLAFVSLVTNTEVEESIDLLKRALTTTPGRTDFAYMLGQLYLRNSDFKSARKFLEHVVASNAQESVRRHAQSLIDQLAVSEEQKRLFEERKKRGIAAAATTSTFEATERPVNTGDQPTDPSVYLREALRKPLEGEIQVQATLVRIDCDAKGITFILNAGGALLRLRAASFDEVDLTTYSPEASGEISCGVRKPENSVVVCYVQNNDKRLKADGELHSIEFVPKDFQLKPKS